MPLPSSTPDSDQLALDRARIEKAERLSIGADHYFVAPQGFTAVPRKDPAHEGLDALWIAGSGRTADQIRVWVGVTGHEASPLDERLADWRTAYAPYLKKLDVKRNCAQLDGHPTLCLTGPSSLRRSHFEVVVAYVNDKTYRIELILSADRSKKERGRIRRQVMQSWRWHAER